MLSQELVIRSAKASDMDALIVLCAQHAHYEKVSYDTKGKAELLAQQLFNKHSEIQCLVVVAKEELIGYATFMKQFSTWDARFYVYLDCLYLDARFRGLGIGRELMIRIKEYADTMNVVGLQWQTPSFNEKAITFYTKLGATSTSKKRFFW